MLISKKIISGFVATSLILIAGCAASSSATSSESTKSKQRFTSKTVGGDTLLTDNSTSLNWTNSKQGCKPIFGKTSTEADEIAGNFCSSLSFGGHSDWRLSTVAEMRILETKTDENGIALYYKNPICARVLARKSDNTLTSISTTNKPPVGRIVGFKLPAGIRCVRG